MSRLLVMGGPESKRGRGRSSGIGRLSSVRCSDTVEGRGTLGIGWNEGAGPGG